MFHLGRPLIRPVNLARRAVQVPATRPQRSAPSGHPPVHDAVRLVHLRHGLVQSLLTGDCPACDVGAAYRVLVTPKFVP